MGAVTGRILFLGAVVAAGRQGRPGAESTSTRSGSCRRITPNGGVMPVVCAGMTMELMTVMTTCNSPYARVKSMFCLYWFCRSRTEITAPPAWL